MDEQLQNFNNSKIKSEELFHILGKRWTLPVIRELAKNNTLGFNQIKNNFQKITPTTLSSVLKTLEQYGIIKKRIHHNLLSSVSYSLTTYGKILHNVSFILEKIPNKTISSLDSSSFDDVQNKSVKQIRNVSRLVKRISTKSVNFKNEVKKYFVPMAALCGASSGLCIISTYVSHTDNMF